MAKKKYPLKAIREKCHDCSGYNWNEVELCPITKCSLYPFRFGMYPETAEKKGKKIN